MNISIEVPAAEIRIITDPVINMACETQQHDRIDMPLRDFMQTIIQSVFVFTGRMKFVAGKVRLFSGAGVPLFLL